MPDSNAPPLFRSLSPRQIPALTGIVALSALAWVYLFAQAAGMRDMEAMMMDGGGMAEPWALAELGYLCVMWSIMMVAMMLPSALPTILVVSKLSRNRRERAGGQPGLGITPIFVSGYLTVWTAYSILAAMAQWVFHATLLVSDAMASASPILSGGLLIVAVVGEPDHRILHDLQARGLNHRPPRSESGAGFDAGDSAHR